MRPRVRRARVTPSAWWLGPWSLACACSGQAPSVDPDQPIQVAGAQFIAGPLPGTPPPAADAGPADQDAAEPPGPEVTSVSAPAPYLAPGLASMPFSGRVTNDAVAVAVRFADLGSGYWVVPAGADDVLFPGQVDFGLSASFNRDAPAGAHALRFVAIDASGVAGPQYELPLFCFDSNVPDNLHTCSASQTLPALVVSLRWDTNFDLDLHVITPAGLDVNPKNPGGISPDGGPKVAGGPVVDRDSLAGCVPDGLRQEDVIFQSPPPAGVYRIYVDPFSACGLQAVRFAVTVYAATGTCPDCQQVAELSQSGEILSLQADGDTSPGLFVRQIELTGGP